MFTALIYIAIAFAHAIAMRYPINAACFKVVVIILYFALGAVYGSPSVEALLRT